MRVAHVITRLIVGGAQENTLWTCRDLIEEFGDEVLLITGPSIGPEGSLEAEARRAGVPLALAPNLQRAVRPWADGRAYREIQKLLRDFQPDVVHTHSAKAGVLGRAAAWNMGVKAVVHTVHGRPFLPGQGRAGRWATVLAERWAARRCHAMAAVAQAMVDVMVEHHIAPAEKFQVVRSGIEIEPLLQCGAWRGETRKNLGWDDDGFVVGKLARLFPGKGQIDLLHAAARLQGQGTPIRLLFIGDGVLRESLQREAQRLGLADQVRFTGLVPPDEVPRWLSAIDALAHLSQREGLARALPQAMLAGKPVVGWRLDGSPEVVREDETGYLLDYGDQAGLISALARLAADPALRRRLGEAGRAFCIPRFAHRETTQALRTLYRKVLQGQWP